MLRRQWPAAAAGVLAVGALSLALAASGGPGADAELGAAPAPSPTASRAATAPDPAQTGPASGKPVVVPESEGAPVDQENAAGKVGNDKKGVAKSRKVTIPHTGPGRFTRAKVDGPKVGKRGALLRYAVKVEKTLPYDAEETARQIQASLSDPRSWAGGGDWRLELVSNAHQADFTIFLATPGTVDRYCWPLRTYGRVSCRAGDKVVLNAWRWAHGAAAYGKDVATYRQYLVNHEVGHRLGHGHVGCPGKGKRAPVMMQQTKGVGSCKANPWPAPKRGG